MILTFLLSILLVFCAHACQAQTVTPKAATPEMEFVMQLNVTLGEAYTVVITSLSTSIQEVSCVFAVTISLLSSVRGCLSVTSNSSVVSLNFLAQVSRRSLLTAFFAEIFAYSIYFFKTASVLSKVLTSCIDHFCASSAAVASTNNQCILYKLGFVFICLVYNPYK